MRIYKLFTLIQNTPRTTTKKCILKENMSDTLKLIFEDTYGPQKYYIKAFEVPTTSGLLTIDDDYGVFHSCLVDLVSRVKTGQDAYNHLQYTVSLYNKEDQEILCKIIDRNLKIGVSLDNFLDVIGEKEDKYEVALAENLSKAKNVNPIDGTYFISRKLDGVRCVCFIEKTNGCVYVSFRSRQNKVIFTLDNLVDPIVKFVKDLGDGYWVLDGEVCLIDEDGNECFHGLMKEITRKNHTIANPKYKVFDILTEEEFWGWKESKPFSDRYSLLCDLSHQLDNEVVPILQERVVSQEVLDRWITMAKKFGWEGCMLRKDVPYKKGRSKDLLKIKGMQDAEYVVTGVLNGKATYNEGGSKEYDIVSSLIISHKNNNVYVGSGLSKEQRLRWFERPEEIIGKTITVQYFEETQDSKTGAYSLRFPVLKYVYDDGRNV